MEEEKFSQKQQGGTGRGDERTRMHFRTHFCGAAAAGDDQAAKVRVDSDKQEGELHLVVVCVVVRWRSRGRTESARRDGWHEWNPARREAAAAAGGLSRSSRWFDAAPLIEKAPALEEERAPQHEDDASGGAPRKPHPRPPLEETLMRHRC